MDTMTLVIISAAVIALSLVTLAAAVLLSKRHYGDGREEARLPTKTAHADFSEMFCADVNLDMVFVKGGKFTMGCTPEQGEECDEDEKPTHVVTLGDFYIGKYEVTQKQWEAVMGEGANPSHFRGGDLPVENVSWNDVQEFIKRLNAALKKNYRLPTEAEWEYAARGGVKTKGFKYAGSSTIGDVAWFYENSGDERLDETTWNTERLRKNNNCTHPVGKKLPNELGLYDMSGNVWEWVSDVYGPYTAVTKIDPAGAPWGSNRVIRGGSWLNDARNCGISPRFKFTPGFRSYIIGFRVVMAS